MSDSVYESFLAVVAEDAEACGRDSDILALEPRGGSDAAWPAALAPRTYGGSLREVEHLVRAADGTVRVSREAVEFTVHFPSDYLRTADPGLQFRVASVNSPLFHPNVRGSLVCLGPRFCPGARLRPLVEQIYRIVCGRVRATEHAFDAEACWYYLSHLEQVRALRAQPLWRRPAIGRAQVGSGHVQPPGSLTTAIPAVPGRGHA